MASVPYEVIDTMLRSNLDVKKCFYQHYQATGALPPRSTSTLQPTTSMNSLV